MDKKTPDFKGFLSSIVNMKDIVDQLVSQIPESTDDGVIRHSLPKEITPLSDETKYMSKISPSVLRPANSNASEEMKNNSGTILTFKPKTVELSTSA